MIAPKYACIIFMVSLVDGFEISEETTLEELCRLFDIEKENCTCEIIPELCSLLKPKHVTITHECDLKLHIVQESINIFASVIGIIGNAAVVLVTIKFWAKSTRCHQLIGGLAAMDCTYCSIQLSNSIPRLWTCDWLYGLVMCKILSSTISCCQLVAVGFIWIIAIERYVGIVHPFSKGLSTKSLIFLILCNFLLGIIFVIPSTYYLEITRFGICQENWPTKRSSLIYTWAWMIFYFIIPITAISILYYKILKTLRTAAKVNDSGNNDYFQRKRLYDNKRIMAILITVLVAFALLVFPNRLAWVIIEHSGINNVNKNTYRALNLFGFIPYSFHVAVNPIIYSLIDANFRQKIIALFSDLSEKQERSLSVKTQSASELASSPRARTRYGIFSTEID